uniref:Uncharacterized protein n=1 Tax=Romanomermis culicivorax TaxID=13658 RepID=A0A915K1F4_ROMCU
MPTSSSKRMRSSLETFNLSISNYCAADCINKTRLNDNNRRKDSLRCKRRRDHAIVLVDTLNTNRCRRSDYDGSNWRQRRRRRLRKPTFRTLSTSALPHQNIAMAVAALGIRMVV